MTDLSAPMSFEIIGHPYIRANSPNRVAGLIGADVFGNGHPFSREGIALDCAALSVGESVEFRRIQWIGVETTEPVIVRRVA